MLKNNRHIPAKDTQSTLAMTETDPKGATVETNQTQTINQVPTHSLMTQSPSAFQSQFAQPTFANNEKTNNSWMWFSIGVLLLIVGLLAGFIWGNQWLSYSQPQSQVQLQSQVHAESGDFSAAQPVVDVNPNKTTQTELLGSTGSVSTSPQASVVEPSNETKPELTQASATEAPKEVAEVNDDVQTQATEDEKQIDIAVDTEGNIVSRVTDLSSNGSPVLNATEEQVALEDVSTTLKASFAEAVKATEQAHNNNEFYFDSQQDNNTSPVSVESSLLDISELSQEDRAMIPPMTYQMHMFSSNKADCWVKINEQVLVEGDELVSGLTLLEIRSEQIIWQLPTKRFSQNSLEDF